MRIKQHLASNVVEQLTTDPVICHSALGNSKAAVCLVIFNYMTEAITQYYFSRALIMKKKLYYIADLHEYGCLSTSAEALRTV